MYALNKTDNINVKHNGGWQMVLSRDIALEEVLMQLAGAFPLKVFLYFNL